MSALTKDAVVQVLREIALSGAQGDVVSAGWLGDIVIQNGSDVVVTLEVPADLGPKLEPVRQKVEEVVQSMPGVTRAAVILTAQRAAAPAAHTHSDSCGHNHGQAPQAPKQAGAGKLELPGVKKIIAVASGKGGVGKSTTAANLALALSRMGLKVALFDADIYGPSMPLMMGLAGIKPGNRGDRILPLENHGVKVMSIGFMMPDDAPIIWRGPMVMGALEQLLREVEWGDVDVMVVDMPPGTGDTQLTMSQRVPLAGAVIVSTPQDIALLDARKGLNMFRKVEVPVLGVIENMSYYVCPSCGHREHVFSHGGARQAAEQLEADFLGEIPLDIKIREMADEGTPIVVADPQGAHAKAYGEIARKVWEKVGGAPAKPRPRFKIF